MKNELFDCEKNEIIVGESIKICDEGNEDEMRELPEGTCIMAGEPYPDVTEQDFIEYYSNNTSHQDIADALAIAHNKYWWFEDEEYDYDEGTEEYEQAVAITNAWEKLMDEYREKVFSILESEGNEIPESGWIAFMEPFMKRHGYYDGAGWWVKEGEFDDDCVQPEAETIPISKLHLTDFKRLESDTEDGMMAQVTMIGEYEIPLNIYIDNYNEVKDMKDCECSIGIHGVCYEIEVYETEQEYCESDNAMASVSLIPIGTFSLDENDTEFVESPDILLSGVVSKVEFNEYAQENAPNYCLTVKTLGMDLTLITRYEGEIEVDNIVHGVAWLYGDISTDD